MAATTLVKPSIEAGAEFLPVLRSYLDPYAAFWSFDEDAERWHFIVGARLVDEVGPIEGYRKVQEAMKQWGAHEELSIDHVFLLGRNDPRLAILRDVPRKDWDTVGAPLDISRSARAGHYVEGAYVYLNVLPQTSPR